MPLDQGESTTKFGLHHSRCMAQCDLQVQKQAQKDMQGGNLDESSVNAYFQQHMQKVSPDNVLSQRMLC